RDIPRAVVTLGRREQADLRAVDGRSVHRPCPAADELSRVRRLTVGIVGKVVRLDERSVAVQLERPVVDDEGAAVRKTRNGWRDGGGCRDASSRKNRQVICGRQIL